jgi:hypothetical protein
MEEVRNQLNEEVQALANSARWRAILDYMASFHQYSCITSCLFRRSIPERPGWRDSGSGNRKADRYARARRASGSSAIAPRPWVWMMQAASIEHPKDGEGEEKTLCFYPLLTVFDL